MPTPYEDDGTHAFVDGHGNPDAYEAPAEPDAQNVGQVNGTEPHAEHAYNHRCSNVAGRLQTLHHDNIYGPPDFEENFYEQNRFAQGNNLRIIGEEREYIVRQQIECSG